MANAAALKTASSDAPPQSSAAEPARFVYAMLTDPGRVRHANQDACAAAPEHFAFVVCDGVGGAAGGEIASQLAVESFLGALRSSASAEANGSGSSEPHARLHHAVVAANAAIFERAQRTRTLRGMATTLVAALLEYPKNMPGCPTLWLAHAGDSRAYRLRRGADGEPAQLTQLTTDHSLVEEHIRAGILRRSEAERSPVRNVITRAVGSMPSVEPEIASHTLEQGDLYLLASDGLTRELSDDAIVHILSTHASQRDSPALETTAHALVNAANQHGGRDNITVLLLACR